MTSTANRPPFDAHRGGGAYAFVSYAHADANLVFPSIASLHRRGVSIWYDEGIDPGKLAILRSQSYCPELQKERVITDLYNGTPARALVEYAAAMKPAAARRVRSIRCERSTE